MGDSKVKTKAGFTERTERHIKNTNKQKKTKTKTEKSGNSLFRYCVCQSPHVLQGIYLVMLVYTAQMA